MAIPFLVLAGGSSSVIASPMATMERCEAFGALKEGIRIHWEGTKNQYSPTTGYSYIDHPKLTIYHPNSKRSISISSERMKIDQSQFDFVFEGRTVIKIGQHQIKTNFLYFRPSQFEIRSFDTYHYQSNGKRINGQGLHLRLKTRILTLFSHLRIKQRVSIGI